MSEDESINGPKIAAAILNRMKGPAKERIVRAIQQREPELAVRIEENLFNFEELTELTPQGMQLLLQSVSQSDLVLSLKTASGQVREAVLRNMSERRQQILLDELAGLPPVRISEVEQAQRRILQVLDELRSLGKLRTQSKNDIWV